jgi:SP family sugar porter-like MFS transporter
MRKHWLHKNGRTPSRLPPGIQNLLTVAWGPKCFAGVSNPNVASLVLGTLQVVLTLGAAGLMDKAGRRILLMVRITDMKLIVKLVCVFN